MALSRIKLRTHLFFWLLRRKHVTKPESKQFLAWLLFGGSSRQCKARVLVAEIAIAMGPDRLYKADCGCKGQACCSACEPPEDVA